MQPDGLELLHLSNTYCVRIADHNGIGAPHCGPGATKPVRAYSDADCNDSAGMELQAPTGCVPSNLVRLYISSVYSRCGGVVFSERALLHPGERASMALVRRRERRLGTIPSRVFRERMYPVSLSRGSKGQPTLDGSDRTKAAYSRAGPVGLRPV